MMDLIEHRINGYLAEPFNIDDMAMGIRWIMEDGERHRDLCGCCREKAVREFDVGIQARRYISLFRLLHPDAR
jgi:glycosyltransferase involved in cell wall biosynthesis